MNVIFLKEAPRQSIDKVGFQLSGIIPNSKVLFNSLAKFLFCADSFYFQYSENLDKDDRYVIKTYSKEINS
jgi:hypothetical protein